MFPAIRVLILAIALPIPAFALCVKTNKAYLRKGPGKKFELSWTVGKYTPLVEIDRKGGWIQVSDQDGEKHWVFRSLVSGGRIRCLSIKPKSAVLRQGPGMSYPLADLQRVDRYTPFLIEDMDEDGNWYHVRDAYGQKFWVHRSAVWRPVSIARVSF